MGDRTEVEFSLRDTSTCETETRSSSPLQGKSIRHGLRDAPADRANQLIQVLVKNHAPPLSTHELDEPQVLIS